MRRVVLACLTCVACAGTTPVASRALVPASAPVAVAATLPAARSESNRWVPRIAPTLRPLQPPTWSYSAPVPAYVGTDATVYLGGGRAGLLHDGRRYVFAQGQLTPVDAPDGAALTGVVAIDVGFAFAGPGGVYVASRFDAPARLLAAAPATFVGVGPRAILLSTGELVSAETGMPIPNTPQSATEIYTHSTLGFAVLRAASDEKHVWYTRDGSAWKRLALPPGAHTAEAGGNVLGERGARIALETDHHVFDIDANGTVRPSTTTSRDLMNAAFVRSHAPAAALVEHYPGALVGSASWTRTGRSDDEWFSVEARQPVLVHTTTGVQTPLGGPLGKPGEECVGTIRMGAAVVRCFRFAAHETVLRIDLDTAIASVELDVDMDGGGLYAFGEADYLRTGHLFFQSRCDGHIDGSLCVRSSRGTWSTHPQPPLNTRQFPFEDEYVTLHRDGQGALTMQSDQRGRRVFVAAEMVRVYFDVGLARPSDTIEQNWPVVESQTLPTPAGIRRYYTPRSDLPLPADPFSFTVDLPFDPALHPTSHKIRGVVAVAGRRGLRLAEGALWETADGWHTWTRVEPPPTGVPADLAGANCTESGCTLGPWAKIGWDLS